MFSQPLTSDWTVWGYYWCDVTVLSEQIEVIRLWCATWVIVEAVREDGEQEHRGVRERRDQSSGSKFLPVSLLAQSKHGPADNVWQQRQFPLNYFLGLLCVWANDLSQVCVCSVCCSVLVRTFRGCWASTDRFNLKQGWPWNWYRSGCRVSH